MFRLQHKTERTAGVAWNRIVALIMLMASGWLPLACVNPPATTPQPTYTPWIVYVTATPSVVGIITADRPVNIAFVLDASTSMNATIGGQRKLRIAQDVMAQLIEDLPANVRAGVWVYGHRVGDSDAEQARSCQDIEELVPVGPLDKPAAIAKVRSFVAKGWTPMATSLRRAADRLPGGADNSVILVSDGKETCGGDPCAAAQELRAQKVSLTIHVVGFGVDAEARSQLECIASAGGGRYFDATTGPELANALCQAVNLVQAPPAQPGGAQTPPVASTVGALPGRTGIPQPTPRRGTRTVPPSWPAQYPAPALAGPANGTTFEPNAQITLSWQPMGTLGPDDYYVVHIQHTTGVDQQWTKGTSLAVPRYLYGMVEAAERRYTWYVVVMRQTGTTAQGYRTGVAISPESEHRWFTWRFQEPGPATGAALRGAPRGGYGSYGYTQGHAAAFGDPVPAGNTALLVIIGGLFVLVTLAVSAVTLAGDRYDVPPAR